MRIGSLAVEPGSKVFGRLTATETHGRFPVEIPFHIVRGATDGPTLLVHAGFSGLEIEPAMVLPSIVKELDPALMRGNLLMVPLLNTSGFEFEQINSVWDDADLNSLGAGRSDGTVSQRLLHVYAQELVARADALLDIRTGAQWSYHCYGATYANGPRAAAEALAVDLGLEHVVSGLPADATLSSTLADSGCCVVTAWIGGGPGLRDYRSDDQDRMRQAVLNALRHLGILSDAVVGTRAHLLRAGSPVQMPAERGLVFMHYEKRGQRVDAGETIGIVRHPFTGQTIADVVAPHAGVMLHAGAVWPLVPEGTPLAMIGVPADTDA